MTEKAIIARNPRYPRQDRAYIDLEVNFPWVPEEWVGYTASAQEDTYGLYGRAVLGEFGEIAPYVPPPVTSSQVNAERDRRVAEGCLVEIPGLGGKVALQGRDHDLRNLQGLTIAATLRLQQGDYTHLTTFRDRNNVDWELTPSQIIHLWKEGADFVSSIYAVAWMLKDQSPIPSNYNEDHLWPSTR